MLGLQAKIRLDRYAEHTLCAPCLCGEFEKISRARPDCLGPNFVSLEAIVFPARSASYVRVCPSCMIFDLQDIQQ